MICLAAGLHLLTDGVCAAALTRIQGLPPRETAFWILLYNLLAFSTQGLTGLLADLLPRRRTLLTRLSACLAALGFLIPIIPVKIVFLGLGNSLFHTAAGAEVILRSPKKAAPLGLFVAPGAMGLTLGTLFPLLGWPFFLLLLAGVFFFKADTPLPQAAPSLTAPLPKAAAAAALLLFAVFSRAFGGSLPFPWKTTAAATLLLTAFVVAGKISGGVLFDRFGPQKTVLFSLPAAAVLILFFSAYPLPSVLGQFLLNFTMPITLFLLAGLCPRLPGFLFGLAASSLFPGYLGSKLLPSGISFAPWITFAVLALNLLCILGATRLLSDRKES